MRINSIDKLQLYINNIEGSKIGFSPSIRGGETDEGHMHTNTSSVSAWSFGTQAIDQFFPQGLSLFGLHEITPACYQDSWAALSFALALLSRRANQNQKPILWCASSLNLSEFGRPYGHGLQHFNLDPARFIIIETKNDYETAYVIEEALKSCRLSAVFGMIGALDLTPSRRLSLMAGKGRTPALLATKPGRANIKTAVTRWQVAAIPADQQLHPLLSLHQASWQVALTRNRQGPADKKWHLEFPSYELSPHHLVQKAFRFSRPSPFRNRKSAPLAIQTKAA